MFALPAVLLALAAPPPELVGPPEPRRDVTGERLPDAALARYGDFKQRGGTTEWVSFSADGKQIVRSRNTVIEIADIATGRDVTPTYLSAWRSARLYVLHDGKHLIHDAGRTNAVAVYDPKTGEKLHDLDLDKQTAYAVTVTPDGKGAVVWWSCNNGCGASAFDFAAGKPVVRHFRMNIWSAYALSPDRKRVYAAHNNTLDVYDFETSKKLDSRVTGAGANARPLVAADGKTVVLSDSGRLWATAATADGLGDTTELKGGGNVDVTYAVSSPDGKKLLVPGTADAVDLAGGDLKPPAAKHKRVPGRTSCFFSADGRLACDLIANQGAVVWNTATGETVRAFPALADLRGLAVTDDRTLTTLDVANTVRVFDLATGKLLDERTKRVDPNKANGWTALVGESGGVVEVDTTSGKVRVADPRTGEEGAELDHRLTGYVSGINTRPDLDRAVVTVQGRAALIELSTGKFLRHLSEGCYGAVLSPNGKLIAAVADNQLSLIETATNKVRRSIPVAYANPNANIYSSRPARQPNVVSNPGQGGFIRFTADGEMVALFAGDGRIWVWSTGDGTVVFSDAAAGSRRVGTLSPDGRWLAFSTPDQVGFVIRDLTEAKAGLGTAHLRGSRSPVRYAAFTSDGKRLITAHADGLALLWDVGELFAASRVRAKLDADTNLWDGLASADAVKAGQVVDDLSRDPAAAVRVLADRVRPAVKPDPKAIAKLIDALQDQDYQAREAAEKALADIRDLASTELDAAAKNSESAEQLERVNKLMARMATAEISPERMRMLRAVEVLERVGTAEARKVLEKLSGGAAESAVTQEAKRALARIDKRASK